jgi:hypothetical protein
MNSESQDFNAEIGGKYCEKLKNEWIQGGGAEIEFYGSGLHELVLRGKVDIAISLCFELTYLQCAISSVGVLRLINNLKSLSMQVDEQQKHSIVVLSQLLILGTPGLQSGDRAQISYSICTQLLGRLYPDILKQHPRLKELHAAALSWAPGHESCSAWLAPTKAFLVAPDELSELTFVEPKVKRLFCSWFVYSAVLH